MVTSTEIELKSIRNSPSSWQTANDVNRGIKTRKREDKSMDVRKRK